MMFISVYILCYCINMVSVTSASHYITPASHYHPRYQSRSSIYIRGLIPRNFAELAEAGSSDWLISLHAGQFYMNLCRLQIVFISYVFKIFFQKRSQCAKRSGTRSGQAFCHSLTESKLFTKIISRRQSLL